LARIADNFFRRNREKQGIRRATPVSRRLCLLLGFADMNTDIGLSSVMTQSVTYLLNFGAAQQLPEAQLFTRAERDGVPE
jgi:hypothetical protein